MRRSTLVPFLAVEGALYSAFLYLDWTADPSGLSLWLKYAGILLCLLFSCLGALRGGDRLVPPALALTALADWFLLVLGEQYLLGVALFLVVQILYLLRLRRAVGAILLWLRLPLTLAFLAEVVILLELPAELELLCALYFAQLLVNTAQAWSLPGSTWRRFALGLTLFVACDVCVGLFNLPQLIPASLHDFARVGMWLFYLPSQVLIALSAFPETKESSQ
ncbi:MAG TPA: hypothetical protein IAC21_04215 [Candidatus Enterenecus merdae]|nr:hypothetical protein [Candidatus Enterenecus merdae]